MKQRLTRDFNSYDVAKNVAFLLMLLDHLGFFLLPQFLILRVVGRGAVVLFAVLFGMSYKNSHNHHKDRIICYAFVPVLLEAHVYNHLLPLNVLFNFYLISFFLEPLYNIYCRNFWRCWIIIIVLLGIDTLLNFRHLMEYGVLLLLLALAGKIFSRPSRNLQDLMTSLLMFFIYGYHQLILFHLSLPFGLLLLLILTLIYWWFLHFSWDIVKTRFKLILLLISRYSLEFFVIQHAIFVGLHRWLY